MPITATFGGQPVEVLVQGMERGLEVKDVDVLYALNRQKSRILDRTGRGLDINEAPFAPYSTRGPYYYYPSRGSNPRTRGRAAGRFARLTGGARTTVGVKFSSYSAFKSSLGRTTVDLTGPSAPHMLQAIVVRTEGKAEGTIGIYGPEADRADGHNVGAGFLPRREFFGASDADLDRIGFDIEALMSARLEGLIK